MEKVFHFDSSDRHYVADAAVICCFDHRINLAVQKFLKHAGIRRPDMIVLAGGAKALASPGQDSERDLVLEQVRLSAELHGAGRLLLLTHSDCGAYGGLARFKRDTAAETNFHAQELQRAAELARSRFPQLQVESYFVNFEGVWKLPAASRESVA
jgi:carbonic anhydrase